MKPTIWIILLLVFSFLKIFSQERKEKFQENITSIQVVGTKTDDKNKIPGSAYTLNKEYLEKAAPTDPMEALRRAPGASIRYQDAAGLTPNISFRGVSNEESRKTLILEDGVLTSLSPYGQPESYYIPSIERMERIEVIKGSGSILFGPNTIGGIVNFVSKAPPVLPKLTSKTIGGENNYLSQFLSYGGTFEKQAYDIQVLRKQGDGFRDHQDFYVNEFYLKHIYNWNDLQTTSIKYSFHEQKANSTYLGLSQGLFWKNPKINPAKYDEKYLDRNAVVLDHKIRMNSNTFQIIGYVTKANRNWSRQDFLYNQVSSSKLFRQTETIPPTEDTLRIYSPNVFVNRAGDSIYMRKPLIARDQAFQTTGVENRNSLKWNLGEIKNRTEIGLRFHFENNFIKTTREKNPDLFGFIQRGILQEEGLEFGAREFALQYPWNLNRQERKIESFSSFFQNQLELTEKWKIILGLRYEEFIQKITTTRRAPTELETNLGLVIPGDTSINRTTSTSTRNKIMLPGFGTTYEIFPKFIWLFGVHKGFSPPTFGTSFSNLGEDYRLKPETSTNYETGFRGDLAKYLYLEVVGYKLFFRDQIVNVREIEEGRGQKPSNTGFSTHTGAEFVLAYDYGKSFLQNTSLSFELIYSYIDAISKSYVPPDLMFNPNLEETLSNFVKIYNYQVIPKDTNGKRLPYVPRYSFTFALGLELQAGFYARAEYQYIDKQFSDLENTKDESSDGSLGVIPKIELWNGSLGWKFNKFTLFINGKNLQDRRYVSGRLPIGIQTAPFRQVNFGISLEL